MASSLRPIATLIASSSKCGQQDKIGSTYNQSTLRAATAAAATAAAATAAAAVAAVAAVAAAASNRARLRASGREANKVANDSSTNGASQERCLQAAVPICGGNGWNGVVQ